MKTRLVLVLACLLTVGMFCWLYFFGVTGTKTYTAETNAVAATGMMPKQDKEYVRIAVEYLVKNGLEIKESKDAQVEHSNSLVIITFPYPYPHVLGRPHPPYPGPEYLARVTIDQKSGRIIPSPESPN